MKNPLLSVLLAGIASLVALEVLGAWHVYPFFTHAIIRVDWPSGLPRFVADHKCSWPGLTGLDTNIMDGRFAEWTETGQLKSQGTFRNGIRHGEWLTYWPNGVPQSRVHYDAGTPVGLIEGYDENGIPYAQSSSRVPFTPKHADPEGRLR